MRFLLKIWTRNGYVIDRAYQEIDTNVVGTYYSLTFCNKRLGIIKTQNLEFCCAHVAGGTKSSHEYLIPLKPLLRVKA